MGTELQMLAWAIALGLFHLLLDAGMKTSERGLAWNASARDGEAKPLGPVAGRVNRAWQNFLETFPVAIVALLGVVIAGRTSHWTALGGWIWLGARTIYLPLYGFGVPVVRTVIWTIALIGLGMVLWPLLFG